MHCFEMTYLSNHKFTLKMCRHTLMVCKHSIILSVCSDFNVVTLSKHSKFLVCNCVISEYKYLSNLSSAFQIVVAYFFFSGRFKSELRDFKSWQPPFSSYSWIFLASFLLYAPCVLWGHLHPLCHLFFVGYNLRIASSARPPNFVFLIPPPH